MRYIIGSEENFMGVHQIPIRSDLYPRHSGLFGSRENYVKQQIKIARSAFPSKFNTKNDLVSFLNRPKNFVLAESFLDLSSSYFAWKKSIKFKPLKLVVIVGLIERMATRQEGGFMTLDNWLCGKEAYSMITNMKALPLTTRDDFNRLIKKLANQYYDRCGSIRNFRKFLRTYLEPHDAFILVSSIRQMQTKRIERNPVILNSKLSSRISGRKTLSKVAKYCSVPVESTLMPSCYRWSKCYIDQDMCVEQFCPLLKKYQKIRKRAIGKAGEVLYGIRNAFIHEGKVPNIGTEGIMISRVGNKVVSITLDNNILEDIFENVSKKYFDNLFSRR